MKATNKGIPNIKKFTLAILLAMGTTALLSGCGNNSDSNGRKFAQVPPSGGQQAPQTQPQEPDKNDVPVPNKTPRYHYHRRNLTALVQSKLEEEISKKTETPVDSVSCPEIKKIVVGETFTCEVTTKDNKTKDVTVTFTNEEGDVKWQLSQENSNGRKFAQVPASSGQQAQQTQPQEPEEIDPPEPNETPRYRYHRRNLTALVQSKLEEEISQKTETTVDSVSCPEIKEIIVGETFTCEVTTKDNKTKDVTVTFTNEAGDVKWQLSQENSG